MKSIEPHPEELSSTGISTYSRPRGRFGALLARTGLVLLCTIILAPIGLVLSMIGYMATRRSGAPSRLALAGLIGNGLLVFIAASVSLYLIFFSPELTDGLIKRLVATDQSSLEQPDKQTDSPHHTLVGKAAANEVAKRTTLYRNTNGVYPLILSDFERADETSLETLSNVAISIKPLNKKTGYSTQKTAGGNVIVSHLTVYACGTTEGNKIGYWNTEIDEVDFAFSGAANQGSTCAIMK